MTSTNEPKRDQPGYRGALPTRDDRLARPWVIIVFAIFVAVIVLSLLQVPSRFEPEATPLPVPSRSASPTPEPTESPSPEPSPPGTGSPDGSPSASPSPTPAP
jgi:hypothetical protein